MNRYFFGLTAALVGYWADRMRSAGDGHHRRTGLCFSSAALLDCADAAVRELSRRDEHRVLRDIRHDAAAGRFDTGRFDDSNVMGYRVRVERRGSEPRATLSVHAAGPCFTGLGADNALSTFRATRDPCMAQAASPP